MPVNVHLLARQRERLRITLLEIALEASRTSQHWGATKGRVITVQHVSQVLSGRSKSANVLAAARRVIARRRGRPGKPNGDRDTAAVTPLRRMPL